MGSFYVENFGCRATQADGAALERQFAERGLERADAATQAGIVVLNTCTVTAAADQDARAAIRRIQRENPGCQIVVTGCYAQRAPEEVAAIPGVSQVIGNSHKHQLAALAIPSGTPEFVPLQRLLKTQNGERKTVPPTTDDQPPTTDVHVSDIFAHTELLAASVFDAANERTRPNLKVQDGCDNRCSFCVIPYVRGQSRSLKLESVIREVQQLVAAGYKEVVISGINLGRWGRDLPGSRLQAPGFGTVINLPTNRSPVSRRQPYSGRDEALAPSTAHMGTGALARPAERGSAVQDAEVSCLASHPRTTNNLSENAELRTENPIAAATRMRLVKLIQEILDHTPLEKLRISSVEPMDWTDELISLIAHSPRIAKHAHVPMQSGSDRILRAMHRKYRPWHYREKIEKIRAAMPSAAIGADVMVGFPGETDADFEETRRMIEDLPFTYLHVFTFSARPGTPAASLPNHVPVKVGRERNRILRDLASAKKLAFMKSFVGKTIQAITLNVFDGEHTEALTDNYLKLRLAGKHEPNQWIEVQVGVAEGGVLVGSLK